MTAKKAGRSSSFTAALAEVICERLSIGQSLREICRDPKMPGLTTVMAWVRDNEEFQKQYARAREIQAEYLVDEIIAIADDGTNDWMLRQTVEGEETVLRLEHINRSRLRIDARKWAASKMAPKKYGDKFEHDVNLNGNIVVSGGLPDDV